MAEGCGFPFGDGDLTSCTSDAAGMISYVCTCPNGTTTTLPQKTVDSSRCIGACSDAAPGCDSISVPKCSVGESGTCNACGKEITLVPANFVPSGGSPATSAKPTATPVKPATTAVVTTTGGSVVTTTNKPSSAGKLVACILIIMIFI